jgi:large subunit ribosomal protein L31
MKKNTHPNWHHDTEVTCSCGSTFTTGSTFKTLTVDLCSACHPFYTGEMKFVDTQGRVDRFMQKMAKAKSNKDANQNKQAKKLKQADQKSYKQLLQEQGSSLKKSKKTSPAAATTA